MSGQPIVQYRVMHPGAPDGFSHSSTDGTLDSLGGVDRIAANAIADTRIAHSLPNETLLVAVWQRTLTTGVHYRARVPVDATVFLDDPVSDRFETISGGLL